MTYLRFPGEVGSDEGIIYEEQIVCVGDAHIDLSKVVLTGVQT